jgi:phosphoserine phosphatase RsbU/P
MDVTDLSVEDFWDNDPCGHLITQTDGRILRVNATLTRWLGYDRNALHGRLFGDLLTAGGRIRYDTHFGPLLRISWEINGVTLNLVAADGARLALFLSANIKTGSDGQPELLRITAVDAADRRAYERDLLEERQRAATEHGRVPVFADTLRRSLLPPVLSPPAGLDAEVAPRARGQRGCQRAPQCLGVRSYCLWSLRGQRGKVHPVGAGG